MDDKQLQKLLDIFIEPKLTISEVDEDKVTSEKSIKRKNISISSLNTVSENLLLSGEQGSGKTKVLNTIACKLAQPEAIDSSKKIPVRLKASYLRDNNFNITNAIKNEVKLHSNIFWDETILSEYTPILFIDDFDLLNISDKESLTKNVQEYCSKNNTHYIITYRRSEFDYDKDIKTVRIHNFNNKQIESFISKFFEGSEKGSHFIRVIKESGLLSKLPTTPLTITLISLLYDENSYEIPATLSDIYSDFTAVLLGKLSIKNRHELLIFNLKRRIFSKLALKMMDEKVFEISYDDFGSFVNTFLQDRSYQEQSDSDLEEIIFNSGLLFKDDNNIVGFKQQAFVEFLASIEIYNHSREKHYSKLIDNFNDVSWQNTAIFYAGHSKELEGMIDDVIQRSPNEKLSDWFINSGGMGYLSQALYQTPPVERKKLVFESHKNILKAYHEMKKQSENSESFFFEIPLPLICGILCYWFNENFKSITLKETLLICFDEIEEACPDNPSSSEFDSNFMLLMLASTLMNHYIGDDSCFEKLIERKSFMNHPILPLVADMIIENGIVDKKNISKEFRNRITSQIKKKREYIKAALKEPAYRFNDDFGLSK